jgi:shikimate kinase
VELLFLIGARGSGKTSVGRLLAERLGCSFRDLDEEVCRDGGVTEGESVGTLLARVGEATFRDMESWALARLVGECADLPGVGVVATGGGIVERPQNGPLLATGRCLWLEAPPEELARRVEADPASRPPLSGANGPPAGDPTPLAEARRVLDRRAPAYGALAEARFATAGCSPAQVAREITDWFRPEADAREASRAPALVLGALLLPLLAGRFPSPPASADTTPSLEGARTPRATKAIWQQDFLAAYRDLSQSAPDELGAAHARWVDEDGEEDRDGRPGAGDRALVLVAGRATPPGLSAARADERERLRAAALDVVRVGLDGDNGARSLWLACLHECLEQDSPSPVLWVAAARVVGELEVEDLAGFVARGLAHPAASPPGLGARRALHGLYHRWFEGEEDYASFRSNLDRPVGGTLYRGPLLAAEAVAFERLQRILELRPAEAVAWVDDPDPAVRAVALAALARGVGRGEVPANQALDVLVRRVAVEVDPAAFHRAVETLLQLLAGASSDAAPLVALRDQLERVLRAGDEARYGTVAVALSRMPWSVAPEDEADPGAPLAWGLARLALLVNAQGRAELPWDGDALAQSLGALEVLCDRALAEGKDAEPAILAEPARERVLSLLADPRAPTSVRLAAAGAAAYLAAPHGADGAAGVDNVGGVGRLADVLDGAGTNMPLRYALLGALARLAPFFDPGQEARGQSDVSGSSTAPAPPAMGGGARILSAFVHHLGRPEVELRARALGLLATPALAAYAQAAGAELYLEGLSAEPSREMRDHLLDLLARFGRPDLVGELLRSPAASDLAAEDGRGVRRLSATLATLAARQPRVLLKAARYLVSFPGPHTRTARLEEALVLVTSLQPDEASVLEVAEHELFIRWALELRAARGNQPLELDLLDRLVDVHLSLALKHGDARTLAHGAALLLGDRVLGEAQSGIPRTVSVPHAPQEVLVWYERALDVRAADLDSGGEEPSEPAGFAQAEILRDRARFYAGLGDDVGAAGDYRVVLGTAAAGPPPPGPHPTDILDLSDLRLAGDLLDRAAATAEDPLADGGPAALDLRDALAASFLLVERSGWGEEPPAVRLQDLAVLADRALRRQGPDLLRARSLFADHVTTGAAGPEHDPSGSWQSLLREAASFETLSAIHARLDAPPVPPAVPVDQPPADDTREVPPSAEDAGSPPEPAPHGGRS